jgi:hypothetical protein
MPKNNLNYIVVNRNTGKYYVVSGERPVGCDRVSLKNLKQNNISFLEIPEIYNKLCKPFHTRFRGNTMIEDLTKETKKDEVTFEDLTQEIKKDKLIKKKVTFEEDCRQVADKAAHCANDIDYLEKLKNISKFKL